MNLVKDQEKCDDLKKEILSEHLSSSKQQSIVDSQEITQLALFFRTNKFININIYTQLLKLRIVFCTLSYCAYFFLYLSCNTLISIVFDINLW